MHLVVPRKLRLRLPRGDRRKAGKADGIVGTISVSSMGRIGNPYVNHGCQPHLSGKKSQLFSTDEPRPYNTFPPKADQYSSHRKNTWILEALKKILSNVVDIGKEAKSLKSLQLWIDELAL
jgi:hypothetical protein